MKKTTIALAFLIASLLVLWACGPDVDTQLNVSHPEAPVNMPSSPRFQVTRVGVFEDGLAYYGKRGMYVIVDNQTGREFFGVSGVGVTELGQHPVGKSYSEDER